MFRKSFASIAALTLAASQFPIRLIGEPGVPPDAGYGRRGAGITMAQQKRAAKKARNVKRHRAACRG